MKVLGGFSCLMLLCLLSGCAGDGEAIGEESAAELDARYLSTARAVNEFPGDDETLIRAAKSVCDELGNGGTPTGMYEHIRTSPVAALEGFYAVLAAGSSTYCTEEAAAVAAFFTVGIPGKEYTYLANVALGQPFEHEPATACRTAMRAAAAVPAEEVNDREFAVTLTECTDFGEWEEQLREFPETIGMTRVADSDVAVALKIACSDPASVESPVCADPVAVQILNR